MSEEVPTAIPLYKVANVGVICMGGGCGCSSIIHGATGLYVGEENSAVEEYDPTYVTYE